MSFEIDGKTWIPQTAYAHATAIFARMNAILRENDVKDSDGNIIQLEPKLGNALWLEALALGERLAVEDTAIQKATESFSVALCDDSQLENLLPVAGVTRNEGSRTAVSLRFTASTSGTLTVPEGTEISYGEHVFKTSHKISVEAGQSGTVTAFCTEVGAVPILSGEITASNIAEGTLTNLASVTNPTSSVLGLPKETTAEIRQRIIKGDTIRHSVDGVQEVLLEQSGITYAKVYFNQNTPNYDENGNVEPNGNGVLTLTGGVKLKPRHAYIVLYGTDRKAVTDADIAGIYCTYMSAQTQDKDGNDQLTYTQVAITPSYSYVLADGITAFDPAVTYYTKTADGYAEVDQSAGFNSSVSYYTREDDTFQLLMEQGVSCYTKTDSGYQKVDENAKFDSSATYYQSNLHQTYVTKSGQKIPVFYAFAEDYPIWVKVVLRSDSPSGDEVKRQLKSDIILASAGWDIGEAVTSMNSSSPLDSITYAKVAYTKVSADGSTWEDMVQVPADCVPVVTDARVAVEVLTEVVD